MTVTEPAVGVAVGVRVGLGVRVSVGVTTWVGVGVGVSLGLAVAAGGVGVAEDTGVAVAGLRVGVDVGVRVCVDRLAASTTCIRLGSVAVSRLCKPCPTGSVAKACESEREQPPKAVTPPVTASARSAARS